MSLQGTTEGNPAHLHQGLDRRVQIYKLLGGGKTRQWIAAKLEISESCVRKWEKQLVDNGAIEMVQQKPRTYRFARKEDSSAPGPMSGAPSVLQGDLPVFMPHRFGARFEMLAKPKGLFDSEGNPRTVRLGNNVVIEWDPAAFKWFIREPHYTAEIGRGKVAVWLKSFTGSCVRDQVINAKRSVRALGVAIDGMLGVRLLLSRFEGGEHWVMVSKEASAVADDACELGSIGKVIADARFKFDRSHPDNLEIMQEPGLPVSAPRDDAEEVEYLIKNARRDTIAVRAEVEASKRIAEGIRAAVEDLRVTVAEGMSSLAATSKLQSEAIAIQTQAIRELKGPEPAQQTPEAPKGFYM